MSNLTITRPAIPVPLPLTRGGTEATTPAGARAQLELGDLALLTAPGGTSTFLRADKTWAVPPGGGGGGGDVSSSTGLSVDSELAVFDGTSGKLLKRGTGSGLALLTSGVLSIKAAPTGAVVGTTDTQTLTGKTISGATNTLTVRDLDLAFTDVTTANVSTTAHGLTPKAPGGTTQFLRGDATWATPPAGTSYTDEQAQDAVGAMLLDTATIDLVYTDATPSLSADVKDASITEAKLSLSDVTTRDASTTAHGLLRKLSGSATQYLDGSGAWTTPAGGGDTYWSRGGVSSDPLVADMLAFWHLEEATGNRLDSVGTQHLVPTGTTVQVTNAAGKIGNALAMTGASGTYLSTPDTAILSAGPNMSFTVACWVYIANTGVSMGFVGKGTASGSTNFIEYLLWQHTAAWHFGVGNGTSSYTAVTSVSPPTNTWCLLVGWYDHVADIQYLQVNNGTPNQAANTAGSYDSTYPFEVGRTCGVTGQSLNGRIDSVGFWKRVLTPAERATLYGGGAGWNPSFVAGGPSLSPLTVTDRLVLAATAVSAERLEVDGALKLGTTTGTTDGTLRWSGTDFEGRKGGAWVSMTAGAGWQPLDATLTALAGLATGADQLPYATGTDTFAQTPLTAFARTLLDDTTQAAMQTTLGLVPGTNVQAQDAELQALAGLTSAADRVPYFTGAGTAALAPFTAAGRTLAGAADAAAQRTALALGTMAQQDASAVAITGGSAQLTSANVAWTTQAGYDLTTNRLYVAGHTDLHGNVSASYAKGTEHGIIMRPNDTDTGPCAALLFLNTTSGSVGSIVQNATATAYNTSSDVRLKHAITALTGALDVVRALRPVRFRWNADDSAGVGFIAHELMQVVPEAVTGEPDAVGPQGEIVPQGVDHSRLVPWLTAALQDAVAQVQALAARVASLEEQLGI